MFRTPKHNIDYRNILPDRSAMVNQAGSARPCSICGVFGDAFTEDACEFLAHHLIYRYSSLSRPPLRSVGGLSSRRLRLVLEYIEDTLDRSIKLRDLAALAGVSASHFERAFHQSPGSSPHAYVMERRLRMARDLLINQPELPVEQIRRRLRF